MSRNALPNGRTDVPVRRFCRPAWFLLGLLAVLSAGPAAAQPRAAAVKAAKVQMRKMAVGQTFVGTVTPLRTSIVGSPVENKVVEFLVNEGDRVEKDRPLAVLRSETLEIEIRAAEAELKLRQRELDELEEGSRPEEIDQAEAQRQAAEALMKYTQQRLERTRRLVERGAITEDELQEQISAALGAAKVFDARQAAFRLAEAGPRQEKIDQAQARVDIQTETIKRLEDDRLQHTILAPFDGYVTREYTEVGQWVAKGAPVVEMVELDSVHVEVPVLETYIANVQARRETPVSVEVESVPGASFPGQVDLIVPQADVRSRSFPVKVRVKNRLLGERPVLKPGMLARVTLPVGEESEVLAVPKDALVLDEERAMVWVVDPKAPPPKQLRRVPVRLGRASQGSWIQVDGNLKPGELVIVEGNERVIPGVPVDVIQVVDPDRGPAAPGPANKTPKPQP